MINKIILKAAMFIFVLTLSTSFYTSAHAEKRVIGTLKCKIVDGRSFIFGSNKELECRFQRARGEIERYRGEIRKYGIDIGFTDKSIIHWEVLSPTTKSRPGVLAGDYTGATAEVTAGVGIGANALVGTNKFMLNPISVSGSTGLNLAAGIANLELFYSRNRSELK